MGLIVKMLTSFVRFFAERYGQPRRKAVGPHHIPPLFSKRISLAMPKVYSLSKTDKCLGNKIILLVLVIAVTTNMLVQFNCHFSIYCYLCIFKFVWYKFIDNEQSVSRI